MKTDLDRLHGVVEGTVEGMRCGKTFAQCHEVVSLIELGEPLIVVPLPIYKDLNFIYDMILDTLGDRGVSYTTKSRHYIKGVGWEIRFSLVGSNLHGFPHNTAAVIMER